LDAALDVVVREEAATGSAVTIPAAASARGRVNFLRWLDIVGSLF
jgi:hypothetical protein